MLLLYLFLFLAFIVAFLTTFKSKGIYQTFLNHYTFFNTVWLTWITLAIFFNSYLCPINHDVYYIFLTGSIFFNITILFIKKKEYNQTIENCYIDIRYRRILELLCIVMLLPQAYLNLKLIQSGVNLWEINQDYWHEVRNTGSYWYLALQQNILAPLSLLLMATSFYSKYVNTNKYSAIITISNSIIIAICATLISGGGRTQIMNITFLFALSALASNSKIYKDFFIRINLKYMVILMLCAILILQWASSGRGVHTSFIQTVIDSYTIFVPNFEYYYKNTDIFSQYTLGSSTFEFFIALIQYPFSILFNYRFYENYNFEIVQNFVYCPALGIEVNARVTPFFYFMRDYGYAGIIIGPIILAIMYNIIFNLLRRNSFLFVIYVGFVLNTFFFMYDFPLGKNFFISLVIAYLFIRIAKVKTK